MSIDPFKTIKKRRIPKKEMTVEEQMNKHKTKNLAFMSLFIAIEILMTMIPFLGFIPIGALRATTLHIPVIIAGIVLGKNKGAQVGLVFGLSSLIINTIQPTVTSFVFSPFLSGSLMSIVIAVIPRMLIGYVAGSLYEKIKNKHQILAMIIGSFLGSFVNTFLVLGGIYLFFAQQYATALTMNINALLPYLAALIATSGLLEAILGAIIAPMVARLLIH